MEPQHADLIIGVTTRHGSSAWVSKNTQNYLNTLNNFGVTAIILAPDTPAHLPHGMIFQPDSLGRLNANILDHLDGLILSGGGDVDPKYFGAELQGAEVESIDNGRDELEIALAQAALAIDMPIFGICRGCQVLNVAAGGGMIQHLDGHRSPKGSTAYHDVIVTPQTRFHQIVGEEAFAVNTFHHQGMDRASIAPIFTPSAIASPDNWLVEAYESPTHDWVVGVQWHPERTFELSDPHVRLWQSFLAACTDRRQGRSANHRATALQA
ncbi:MAG: gamma-glutamyl-gamma-aminobutyrate hydrolase family protein [Caldilineaceae bacterium]|nr:gamma-glutamyl-gamma-aminobutyrate hydrolase family protein [Caldilineaceae bacterium]